MKFGSAAKPRYDELVPPDGCGGTRDISLHERESAARPRVGSAVLITDCAGRVLLGRRAKDPNRGRWVLPGGGVEPFEPLSAAAIREAAEETGLDIEVTGHLGVLEIIDAPREHRVIVYSWARAVGGSLRASTDISELAFVAREELPSMDVSPIVRDALTVAGLLPAAPDGSLKAV